MSFPKHRELVPELMDDPNLDFAEHVRALGGLARIGRFSGTARLFGRHLRELAGRADGRPLRVLDLATGGGELPVSLAAMAQAEGWPIEFWGCDASERALDIASKSAADAGVTVNFFRAMVPQQPLDRGFDVVTSNLFLHHLEEEQVAALLRHLATCCGLVLMCDLDRTRLGWWLASVGCRLLSRSPVVHVDGPRSVCAAFRPAEIAAMAEATGLSRVQVRRVWPERWMLVAEGVGIGRREGSSEGDAAGALAGNPERAQHSGMPQAGTAGLKPVEAGVR